MNNKNKIILSIGIVGVLLLIFGSILFFMSDKKLSFAEKIAKMRDCKNLSIDLKIESTMNENPTYGTYHFDLDRETGLDYIEAEISDGYYPISWFASYDANRKLYYYKSEGEGVPIKEKYIDYILELLESAKEKNETEVVFDKQLVQDVLMSSELAFLNIRFIDEGITLSDDVHFSFKTNEDNGLIDSLSSDFIVNEDIPITITYLFSYPEG